jgi:hypothetical protein
MKPLPLRRGSAAINLRQQIEKAEADGLDRAEMMLRLTHADASSLKRDPEVALADISFADGVMRFLGVRVVEGGVTQSELVPSE